MNIIPYNRYKLINLVFFLSVPGVIITLVTVQYTQRVYYICEVMNNRMSSIERKILAVLQKGLPKSQRPFHDMANEIGIDTSQLLEVLKDWQQQGKLRRIGAIVNHFKVGLGAGAMVWPFISCGHKSDAMKSGCNLVQFGSDRANYVKHNDLTF